MAEVSAGPASYTYVCTRMRVRKAKLLPREEYLRMLNMSLPEITRVIEESEYKTEIDELGPSFSGIDLVEVALSWNLAKEYQNILGITPGILKEFAKSYLRSWDIQNVLSILRGKSQGIPSGKIKEILIPAGSLDRVILDRLLAEDSIERIVEGLRGSPMYPLIEREMPAALESGSFARLENELYKQYYAELITDARAGLKGGRAFEEYIRLAIDIRNMQNLFRSRKGGSSEDIAAFAIQGGSFRVDELQRIAGMENADELIDTIAKKARLEELTVLLEEIRSERPIHEIEIELTRIMLEKMERMSKRYPFSVLPILVYLEKKKYEVINLRTLARGKQADLPDERIKSYLVV